MPCGCWSRVQTVEVKVSEYFVRISLSGDGRVGSTKVSRTYEARQGNIKETNSHDIFKQLLQETVVCPRLLRLYIAKNGDMNIVGGRILIRRELRQLRSPSPIVEQSGMNLAAM